MIRGFVTELQMFYKVSNDGAGKWTGDKAAMQYLKCMEADLSAECCFFQPKGIQCRQFITKWLLGLRDGTMRDLASVFVADKSAIQKHSDSQRLGEKEPMLLGPSVTSTSRCTTAPFISPLCKQCGGGRSWTSAGCVFHPPAC